MPKIIKRDFQIGDYWLSQRKDSPVYYANVYSEKTQSVRRFSLRTKEFELAKEKLLALYLKENKPKKVEGSQITMAEILFEYYEGHAKKARSGTSIKICCRLWAEFFGEDSLEDATNAAKLESFISWLEDKDYSTAYIQRIMGVGKAALNRSYRRGAIKAVPYIPSIKVNYGDPKGRALSAKEVALLLTHASDHMRLFIYIMLGTACRPEAAFDLTGAQLDFENRLIELNPHGRAQTKKIRPIVKMPETLALLLQNAPNDHLIKFRGKRVKCVRTAWRNLRAKCKLDDAVQPYSLRHTMARHMRKSGVSAWETAAQLGHKSREYRTTELYAPFDPDYLSEATIAIDAFFDSLLASYSPVIKPYFSVRTPQVTDVERKSGAGDEIRTHDPHLGKVMLYH